jgi:hypothetical protein
LNTTTRKLQKSAGNSKFLNDPPIQSPPSKLSLFISQKTSNKKKTRRKKRVRIPFISAELIWTTNKKYPKKCPLKMDL